MHLPSTLSRLVRLATAALCAVPLVSAVAIATAPAAEAASVPSLHAPYFGPRIEPMVPYVEQNSCQPGFRAGSAALARLLVRTYPNTSAGGPRGCLAGSPSEHYDGRAVDWMNSVKNPVQAMQAASVIKFLLATDSYGNKYAMARRMGIMYMIWDNHIWGMWSGRWEDYNGCTTTPSPALDTACHRDHIHFSMSWDGALGYTSFWSRKVVTTPDYGPCRPRDLNWAADYAVFRTVPCPNYPQVAAPAGSSAVMIGLVQYSGVALFPGMTGEPVKVVQRAFNKPVTGRYDAVTVAAVNRVKIAHRLPVNGVVDPTIWRLLLAAYRPRS
ncbi:MAG TPA: peptidoglycan-binding domain-containing protein [Jatrophihabitans sp.]|nr:peptidoglycan-binding domain-containing protein [Jatrophihabitans sp.]